MGKLISERDMDTSWPFGRSTVGPWLISFLDIVAASHNSITFLCCMANEAFSACNWQPFLLVAVCRHSLSATKGLTWPLCASLVSTNFQISTKKVHRAINLSTYFNEFQLKLQIKKQYNKFNTKVLKMRTRKSNLFL